MQILVKAMLIAAGLIHLLPLPGIIGARHLERLYGLSFTEPNLLVIMRHRAVLFGLLGIFMISAAFRAELVPSALVGGLISATAFIVLAWSVGDANAAIERVVIADYVAVACLVTAAVCQAASGQQS